MTPASFDLTPTMLSPLSPFQFLRRLRLHRGIATLVRGADVAASILDPLKEDVVRLRQLNVRPCLATVRLGEDAASAVYLRKKREAAAAVGVRVEEVSLPASATREDVLRRLSDLNLDSGVHGVLLQLPLPPGLSRHELELCNAVDPRKDVDGFTARNLGAAAVQRQSGASSPAGTAMLACTPLAVKHILLEVARMKHPDWADDEQELRRSLSGGRALVLGRSHNVGTPIALMLMSDVAKGGFDLTTTVCHRASHARDVSDLARTADVLVSAVGSAGLVKRDMVKPGAAVVDVGISRQEGSNKVAGDACPEVAEVAGFLTPVPGGVGPCTVACLISNVVLAAKRSVLASELS